MDNALCLYNTFRSIISFNPDKYPLKKELFVLPCFIWSLEMLFNLLEDTGLKRVRTEIWLVVFKCQILHSWYHEAFLKREFLQIKLEWIIWLWEWMQWNLPLTIQALLLQSMLGGVLAHSKLTLGHEGTKNVAPYWYSITNSPPPVFWNTKINLEIYFKEIKGK